MSLNKNELNITLIHYSNKYKFLELVIFSTSKIIKYKKTTMENCFIAWMINKLNKITINSLSTEVPYFDKTSKVISKGRFCQE